MTEKNRKKESRSEAIRPAVWLARVARVCDPPLTSSINFARATAREIAAHRSVVCSAEYLYVADQDTALSAAGWRELLVLTPEELASDVGTFARRSKELERRQVELLLLILALAAGDAAPKERSRDVAA